MLDVSIVFAATNSSDASNRLERLVRIAVIIIALCTVVDVLLVLSLGIRYYSTSHTASSDDYWDNLEMRSSYVNLDQLYSKPTMKSSKHGPIINHARAFVQISSTEPDRVFPPYRKLIQLDDGFVPPNERRLLMTPQVSRRNSRINSVHCLTFLTLRCPPWRNSGLWILGWRSAVSLLTFRHSTKLEKPL